MLAIKNWFYLLLKLPIKILVRCKILADDMVMPDIINKNQPIFYVIRHQSASDIVALHYACKTLNLPDPLEQVEINGQYYYRTLCLEKPCSIFKTRKQKPTSAIHQGLSLLDQHDKNSDLDVQLIPANLIWGRTPTKEHNNATMGTILADQESPSWLRKFFIVFFLGRYNIVRFSEALSFRFMADNHGTDTKAAQKLLRVARFHFHKQNIAAKGPRLMHRQQMFTALFANPAVKKIIEEESKNKNLTKNQIKKDALKIMDEIAGDYNDSMVRFGERILGWLWNKLYKGIEVNNAKAVRDLAQEGHEIIYVPCHRSHMDYLLLTYVIFQQGLVTPRIAAGINLNFWPAGPIFRKAGAFFIRRSFKGNRLYSTIFREYLSLLFERGYSVKYYSEGGRSRTGRLLTPKTGMLAMTMQSILRGINRPLTLVPVYIGYEHVMEVGTYHKELSGNQKKNESIFGVFKAIKNLRNYGKGYVNFGQPININQYLNKKVPDWKEAINPIEPQKPSWLIPTVNMLANDVMVAINKCAALNAVTLVALILHSTKNKALTKQALETQLDFFLSIQKKAPYSNELSIPTASGKTLLAEVIALDKVTVNNDSFGDIISLVDSAALEMRYYRNNILHTYLLPALICRLLDRNIKINNATLIEQVHKVMPLLSAELFLWQSPEQFEQQTVQSLQALCQLNIIQQSKAGFWSLCKGDQARTHARVMGECIDESMQRCTIILSLITRLAPIKKETLENNVVAIAKRLSVLNNINAAEFIDKKVQAKLIQVINEQGYINLNSDDYYQENSTLPALKELLDNLVNIEVLQSISG